MKTIKQWLETIADKEIREAAISQIKDGAEKLKCDSLLRAIYAFNLWLNTKEGWKYWNGISIKAETGKLETREVEEEEEDEEWGMAQGWIDRCDQVVEKAIKILEKQEQEIKDNANEFTYAWNASKYTKTEQEDGTIILKPKKKKLKVWIEVYLFEGEMRIWQYNSFKELEQGLTQNNENSTTLLEVIEREYEI